MDFPVETPLSMEMVDEYKYVGEIRVELYRVQLKRIAQHVVSLSKR